MSKKTTLLTVVIAAVLLLAVIAIAMNAPDKKTTDETATNTTETTQTPTTSTETPATPDKEVAATIVYTENGFEPSSLTVKSGDTVRIENKSSSSLSFNSGDHPTHTKDSDLNVGEVPRGGSRTFIVTKKGTWSFHNHDNAAHEGTITVE